MDKSVNRVHELTEINSCTLSETEGFQDASEETSKIDSRTVKNQIQ